MISAFICYASYIMRLNKFIAYSTGLSRREADQKIIGGHVTINDQPAHLGQSMNDGDQIKLDGRLLTAPAHSTIVMLNKPTGYVCSRNAQADGVKTVYELLPADLTRLKTVGRLDKDSSGLILLTDDGDLAHKLTHPSFAKSKEYIVTLDRPLAPLHQQMVSDFGINLEDGPSRLLLTSLNDDRTKFQVIMHEGRNRQIRRTFASLGYQVIALHRIGFGEYALGDLATGSYKVIS